MIYELPTSVEVNGTEYQIRSDYRPILDILLALEDPELSDQDKALVVLSVFYPDFEDMSPVDYEEAVKKCFWFINCGSEGQNKKAPKLMDWEKDFQQIVAPINRVAGKEIRSIEYLHWWTFISYYYEIGDCLFAQIVRIREKKARGKPLDKSDKEFYRKNRDLIDIQTKYTEAENQLIEMLMGNGAFSKSC